MSMVGNGMGEFMQYQTAQAIPKFAEGGGGGAAVLPVTSCAWVPAWRWARFFAQNLQAGLQTLSAQAAPVAPSVKADDIMVPLEKLSELKVKDIPAQEESDAKKAELLKHSCG